MSKPKLKFKGLEKSINNELTDNVVMDVKAPLYEEAKYRTVTQCDELSIKDIHEPIELIMRTEIDYEFWTTLVSRLSAPESFQELNPYPRSFFSKIRNRIKDEFNECEIGGV